MVAFIILLAGSAVYTSQSSFCITCHYMEPFYDSWKSSKHNNVECIQCHFAPGLKNKIRGKMEGLVQLVKYASQSYKKTKPWAEIPDESCLRGGCHEVRLLEKEVQFKEGIAFNHKPHLTEMSRGKKLRCTSCHSQVVQGDHMSVAQSTCFICHFKKETPGIKKAAYTPEEMKTAEKVSECTTCHTKQTLVEKSRAGLFSYDHSLVVEANYECKNCHAQTVVGNAPVHKQNCFLCHWETEKLDKFSETETMHRVHISEHKVECLNCHTVIEHKITHKSVENIADCLSCHERKHMSQSQLFLGVGGHDAKSHPNKMAEIGLNCRGCHIFHELRLGEESDETTPFYAKYESCDRCHGEGYGKILGYWKETTEKKLKVLDGIYIDVGQEVEKIDAMLDVEVKRFKVGATVAKVKENARIIMDEAHANMAIVRKGKSVHNIEYSMELLNVSYGKFKETLALIGSKYKLPFFELEQPEPFAECLICHKDIKEHTPDIAGLTFSHKNHLEDKRRVEEIEGEEEEEDEDLDDEDLDDEDDEDEEEEIVGRRLTCQRCHSNVRKHGELAILKSKCAACHHDPDEVEKKCEDCHILQRDIIMGKWEFVSKQAKMSPDAKKKGIAKKDTDCKDCHDRNAEGKRPEQKMCLDCHKESEAGKFTVWQNYSNKMIADMTQTIYKLKIAGIDEADRPNFERIKKFTKGFINDGSLGVHNPAIHKAAKKIKEELDKLAKATLPSN